MFSHWLLSKTVIRKRIEDQTPDADPQQEPLRTMLCLKNATDQLINLLAILAAYPVRVPHELCIAAKEYARNHNSLFRSGGGILRPKHHELFEMMCKMPRTGNPLRFSTYRDETFNQVIATMAKKVSRRRFPVAVMLRYQLLRSLQGLSW